MKRTAQCHCGDVTVEATGEPDHVFICHCTDCQRKTGSAFQVGAWYVRKNVTVNGKTHLYTRKHTDRGNKVDFHFCPTCGTSILNTCDELEPDNIGIAMGCFSDPNFPAPTLSIYGKNRMKWISQCLSLPDDIPKFVSHPYDGSKLEGAD